MRRIFLLEQAAADVPACDDWLDRQESRLLSTLRFEKRRCDWRLGRWTAKNAVAERLGLPRDMESLASIRIETEPGGAPLVVLRNGTRPVTISISHSFGLAICAVARPESRLGCDLERLEPRSAAFVSDYFTAAEQAVIVQAPEDVGVLLPTVYWSAKESALKALGKGLRIDTRTLTVTLSPFDRAAGGNWSPIKVCFHGGLTWYGWWQCHRGFVRTFVSDTAAPAPA